MFVKKYNWSASEHDLQVRCRYKFTLFRRPDQKVLCGGCEQRTSDAIYPRSKGSSVCDLFQIHKCQRLNPFMTCLHCLECRLDDQAPTSSAKTRALYHNFASQCTHAWYFSAFDSSSSKTGSFPNGLWFHLIKTYRKSAHYEGESHHIKYTLEHWPSNST